MKIIALNPFSFNSRPKSRNQIEAENKLMLAEMKKAKYEGRKLTSDEVRDVCGITKSSFESRIANHPELSCAWQDVKRYPSRHFSVDEVAEQINNISNCLDETIAKDEKIKVAQIAQDTGLTSGIVTKRINSVPELKEKYEKVKYTNPSKLYTDEEKLEQEIQLRIAIRDAIARGRILSSRELGALIGVSSATVLKRVSENEVLNVYYNAMCNITPSSAYNNNHLISYNQEYVINALRAIFAAAEKKPILNELVTKTGFDIKDIQKAISQDKELSEHWFNYPDDVKNSPTAKSAYEKELIERALNSLKETNLSASYFDISQQTGLNIYTIVKYDSSFDI